MKDRLELLIKHFCDGNKRQFSLLTGVSSSIISNLTGGRENKPSYEVILKILQTFSNVNPDWFILGNGDMLRSDRDFINDQDYIAVFNRVFQDTLPLTDLSIRELALFCNIKTERLENIFYRQEKMERDDLSKIVHKLGLSPSWVVNGIGNQFVNPIDKERIRKEYDEYIKDKLPTINKESKGSPYYNVDFIGGFDLLMNDQTINPDFYINYPPYNKDGVVWVNLTGYSMEPELRQGDIIALKPVSTPIEYLPTNEIYAIVTEDYRTVKRIELSDREGFIRLLPSNPEYKAQEIPINMITKVYAVLGSIRKFF